MLGTYFYCIKLLHFFRCAPEVHHDSFNDMHIWFFRHLKCNSLRNKTEIWHSVVSKCFLICIHVLTDTRLVFFLQISGITTDVFGYRREVSIRGCPWVSLLTRPEVGCTGTSLDGKQTLLVQSVQFQECWSLTPYFLTIVLSTFNSLTNQQCVARHPAPPPKIINQCHRSWNRL